MMYSLNETVKEETPELGRGLCSPFYRGHESALLIYQHVLG